MVPVDSMQPFGRAVVAVPFHPVLRYPEVSARFDGFVGPKDELPPIANYAGQAADVDEIE